jgi:hypothetical protein
MRGALYINMTSSKALCHRVPVNSISPTNTESRIFKYGITHVCAENTSLPETERERRPNSQRHECKEHTLVVYFVRLLGLTNIYSVITKAS